jgi:glycosyltransferase involved in cell wall biosynthesis
MEKNILLIGSLPQKRATGASLGFESLIDGFKSTPCEPKILYILDSREEKVCGKFSWVRAKDSLIAIFSAWWKIPPQEVLYMTIASSKLGFLRDMMIILFASMFQKRIILHLHGGGYQDFYENQSKWLQSLIRSTLGKSTNIIVLGELLRDQFNFVPNIESKIKVIPNGLINKLNPSTGDIKFLPDKDNPIRLLYLSNLIPSKGYFTLLDASIDLINNHKVNLICDFCGEFTQTIIDDQSLNIESQKEEFFQRIKNSGLDDRIIYHGTVSGEKKETMLREAHFFVLPTYYPWEGQPISIIEALAFGTPVISTPHKGIPEQVKDGYNGFLVPPNNHEAIVKAILKGIESYSYYSELSKAALEHFNSNFTRDVHLKRLISVICNTETI